MDFSLGFQVFRFPGVPGTVLEPHIRGCLGTKWSAPRRYVFLLFESEDVVLDYLHRIADVIVDCKGW